MAGSAAMPTEPSASLVSGVGEDSGFELHYVETGREETTLSVALVARREDAVHQAGSDERRVEGEVGQAP